MRREDLLKKLAEKKEGAIRLLSKEERVNRPEDGYQPTLEAMIIYELNGSELGEEGSLADSFYELQAEKERILMELEEKLVAEGYECIVDGFTLYFRREEEKKCKLG